MTLPDWVETKIERVTESGCWIWIGALSRGYGHIWDRERKRAVQAHRLVYAATNGFVPEELDHLCRVKCCVNPRHLEPVTHRENVLRSPDGAASSNWRKTHCIRGHALQPYRGSGRRRCPVCDRDRRERYKERYRIGGQYEPARRKNHLLWVERNRDRVNAYKRAWRARQS